MKKVILSIAFVAGLGVMTNAGAVNVVNEQSSVAMFLGDDGFVDVPLENLNEKVQASVKALEAEYDVTALKYNAEKQLTKVKATKKEDQSEKVFYFDADGKEVKMDTAPAEGVEAAVENPSPEGAYTRQVYTRQDDGFTDIQFEELNGKVQDAVRLIAEKYELNALQFNTEKKLTKVKATSKDDQSQKTFYLDEEGKEVTLDAAPQETKTEEVGQTEEIPMG